MNEPKTVFRAVRQYSLPLPDETMEFLRGIAVDYAKVKEYVFLRYSGIGSIEKLYPKGYTIQNEMNTTDFRKEVNLPQAYYSQAMFEAIGSIKSGWSNLKNKIISLVRQNENLTDLERHYIYTILKFNKSFSAILNRQEVERPKKFKDVELDYKRLHNLICRLTRKHIPKHSACSRNYFKVVNTGFDYVEGGLRLCTREWGKRLFIPLADNLRYTKPLTVIVLDDRIEISISVESKTQKHDDYNEKIALHLGYLTMFTTSDGNKYGEKLGDMLSARTERILAKRRVRGKYHSLHLKALESNDIKRAKKIKANNLGSMKFVGENNREMAGIYSKPQSKNFQGGWSVIFAND
jgi:hypothetical protein